MNCLQFPKRNVSLIQPSLTEPPAFFVDVLFNASVLPSSNQDSQEKRTAKNALASTQIAYAGEATEYTVDMGLEVRL